jgi:hypothetical protein
MTTITSPTTTWTAQRPSQRLPEELLVILVQLLLLLPQTIHDDTTVTNHESSDTAMIRNGYRWRLRLVDSIETLQQHMDETLRHEPHDDEQYQQWLLLHIEPQMKQLRMELQEFTTTILPPERQQIMSLYQQIVVWQQRQQHQQRPAMYHFLYRLISEYQLQWQYEEQMMHHVLYPTLDTWYDNDDSTTRTTGDGRGSSSRTNVQLQFCVKILRRLWTLQEQQQYFQDNIELLLQLVEEQTEDMNIDSNHHQVEEKRRDTEVSLLSFIQKQFQTAKYKSNVKNEIHDRDTPQRPFRPSATMLSTESASSRTVVPSIIDEAISFIHRTNITGDNHIKTLLLIGSEGSGKTYLCNQLEELLSLSKPSAISGTYYIWTLMYSLVWCNYFILITTFLFPMLFYM